MRSQLKHAFSCALCALAVVAAGCQAPAPDPAASTSTAANTASVAPAAPANPPAAAAPAAPAPATTSGAPAAPPEPGVPEPVPSLPTAEQDTCGAAAYSVWVGQDHTKLPAAPAGKAIRVVCTTCPMTMDFSAERLNVIYDEKTGLVTRLSCG